MQNKPDENDLYIQRGRADVLRPSPCFYIGLGQMSPNRLFSSSSLCARTRGTPCPSDGFPVYSAIFRTKGEISAENVPFLHHYEVRQPSHRGQKTALLHKPPASASLRSY